MTLAPIVIFCYKRLDVLKKSVESLCLNPLAKDSDLIVFSDGPKSVSDIESIRHVRDYLAEIRGFKSVTIHAREHNLGLANSIISGVTEIIKDYGKVIVVEDDLVASTNFLHFMNSALEHYENAEKVFSISGYTPVLSFPADYPHDSYFTLRSCSWGWATWKNRWESINWDLDDFDDFSAEKDNIRAFNRIGSDLYGLLKKQHEGKIDSWAIRWCYYQFKKDLFCAYPRVSKIKSIGYGAGATHTSKKLHRFSTVVDTDGAQHFSFAPAADGLNPHITRRFSRHYGILNRLLAKIMSVV